MARLLNIPRRKRKLNVEAKGSIRDIERVDEMTARRNRFIFYDALGVISLIVGIFLLYKGHNIYGILLIGLAFIVGLYFYMRIRKKVDKYKNISTLKNWEMIIPGVILLIITYLGFTEESIKNFISEQLPGLVTASPYIFVAIGTLGLILIIKGIFKK